MAEMQSIMGNESGRIYAAERLREAEGKGEGQDHLQAPHPEIRLGTGLLLSGAWLAEEYGLLLLFMQPIPAPYIATIQSRPLFITFVVQTLTRQLDSHVSWAQKLPITPCFSMHPRWHPYFWIFLCTEDTSSQKCCVTLGSTESHSCACNRFILW